MVHSHGRGTLAFVLFVFFRCAVFFLLLFLLLFENATEGGGQTRSRRRCGAPLVTFGAPSLHPRALQAGPHGWLRAHNLEPIGPWRRRRPGSGEQFPRGSTRGVDAYTGFVRDDAGGGCSGEQAPRQRTGGLRVCAGFRLDGGGCGLHACPGLVQRCGACRRSRVLPLDRTIYTRSTDDLRTIYSSRKYSDAACDRSTIYDLRFSKR